jgi:hypothetical protein
MGQPTILTKQQAIDKLKGTTYTDSARSSLKEKLYDYTIQSYRAGKLPEVIAEGTLGVRPTKGAVAQEISERGGTGAKPISVGGTRKVIPAAPSQLKSPSPAEVPAIKDAAVQQPPAGTPPRTPQQIAIERGISPLSPMITLRGREATFLRERLRLLARGARAGALGTRQSVLRRHNI